MCGGGLEFTGKRQPAIKNLQQLSLKLLDQAWWPHKICQPSVSWKLSLRHCLLSPGATFSGIPSHTDFSFSKHSSPHIPEPLQLQFPLSSSPWNRLPSALHLTGTSFHHISSSSPPSERLAASLRPLFTSPARCTTLTTPIPSEMCLSFTSTFAVDSDSPEAL